MARQRDRRQITENGTHHYVSERKKRSKQRASTVMQPPLTPMIDVVFQLLLFFLLACHFRMTEGQIQANLPNVSGPQITPPLKVDPIRISLSPTGVDGEGVLIELAGIGTTSDPLELFGKLKQLHDHYQSPDVPVIIKPVGKVRWAHVVDAFNQAVRAQFKNIGFAPADS